MKKLKTRLSIIMMIIVAFSASTNLFGQETKIETKDLPPAVAKAFRSAYPDAKIIGTAKEAEKGVKYFEIESKDGKVRRDLLYTKAGEIAEIEEVLSAETIPAFVKKTIENKFKGVEFKKGEKNTRNSVTKYEVVIEASEVKYEVVCDANGKILKSTRLKDEKGEVSDND